MKQRLLTLHAFCSLLYMYIVFLHASIPSFCFCVTKFYPLSGIQNLTVQMTDMRGFLIMSLLQCQTVKPSLC